MTDDKPAGTKAMQTEEDAKQEKSRKKSVGILDPGPVLSGPRQRKKAESLYQVEVKEKADFSIKPGKGTKLGEIPNVHYHIGKLKTDDDLLIGLHHILFRRAGTANRRKKDIYEFSGLTFEDDEKEKELEKVHDKLNKWTIALLNSALDVFELPRGQGDDGKKEAKVDRLVKFLEEPKQMSDKDLAAEAAKKKEKEKAKREKEQKAKTPKSAAKESKTPKSAAKSSKKAGTAKESAKKRSKEESEEEAVEEASEEQEEEVEPPKKRAKKEAASAEKSAEQTAEKKTVEKKAPSAKKPSAKKRKPEEAPAEEGEGAGTSDKFPSEEEVKKATLDELKVSDVNTTTVKDILKKLKAKFGRDLSSMKAFVKQIAVEYANSAATGSSKAEDDAKEAMETDTAPAAEGDGLKKLTTDFFKELASIRADMKQFEDECAENAEALAAEMAAADAEAEALAAEAKEATAEPKVEEAAAEPKTEAAAAEPKAAEAAAKPENDTSVEQVKADEGVEAPEPEAAKDAAAEPMETEDKKAEEVEAKAPEPGEAEDKEEAKE